MSNLRLRLDLFDWLELVVSRLTELYDGEDELEEAADDDIGVSERWLFLPFVLLLFKFDEEDLEDIFVLVSSFDLIWELLFRWCEIDTWSGLGDADWCLRLLEVPLRIDEGDTRLPFEG